MIRNESDLHDPANYMILAAALDMDDEYVYRCNFRLKTNSPIIRITGFSQDAIDWIGWGYAELAAPKRYIKPTDYSDQYGTLTYDEEEDVYFARYH